MSSRNRRKAPLLPRLFLLGLTTSSIFSFVGAEVPWFSLFSHFQLYSAAAWLVFLLLFKFLPAFPRAFWRPQRIPILACFFLFGHLLFIASLWLPGSAPDLESPDKVDIVWFNMMFKPTALQQLEDILADDLPDIIALGEIAPKTEVSLPGYPYQLRSAKDYILIVSKFPLERAKLVQTPSRGREQPSARVVVGRRRFDLVAVHMRQPVYPSHYQEMQVIAETAYKVDQAILIGDFNTTVWSAEFRRLCRDADLQHGRQGRGILNTWSLGPRRWIPLPIDHMLYKGEIEMTDFELMDWTYSDHRPIRGKFLLGGKRQRKAASNL
ncbi:MAG: endonuclease/exonuclease/phosphatase family protein [Planctomycetota bacterium]